VKRVRIKVRLRLEFWPDQIAFEFIGMEVEKGAMIGEFYFCSGCIWCKREKFVIVDVGLTVQVDDSSNSVEAL
jgi:hypothetical protein